MTKFIFIVGLFSLLVSCHPVPDTCSSTSPQMTTDPSATPNCTPVVTPVDAPTEVVTDPTEAPSVDVPPEALIFAADITLTNFAAADEAKVNKAIVIIKKVIAGQEFKDRVINFSYGGKKNFVDNDNLSNAEVYQKLLDGSETLRPGIDHQMDLELELYYSMRSTVGYTYPDGLRIWMNTKFFNSYTPSEVAGNIFHEWTHKLGFDHAASYSVSRDSSVPYALGYLVEELGKKYE